MAFVIDTTSSGSNASTNALTWSHTNNGNLLVVVVGESQVRTVSSVTYNAVSLTLAITVTNGNAKAYIYYLVNPAAGANNVVVNYSTSADSIAGAASFSGCNVSDPLGQTNTVSGTAQNKSITITPDKRDSLIIDCIGAISGNHNPSGAGQTEIFTGANRTGSYEILSAQQSVLQTQSWTSDVSDIYAMVVAEFQTLPSGMFLTM